MEKLEDRGSSEIQMREVRDSEGSRSIPSSDTEDQDKLEPEVSRLNVLLICKETESTQYEPDIFPKHLLLDEKTKDEVRNVFSQNRPPDYPFIIGNIICLNFPCFSRSSESPSMSPFPPLLCVLSLCFA